MKVKVIDFGYKKLPERKHYNDAGADVCVCFHDEEKSEGVWIFPQETMKIPLGLGLCLPDGFAAFVFSRSGLASDGIVCELPPIDSGYRGEIHAIVTNCGAVPKWIEQGDRIGQLVITPIILADFYGENDLVDTKERGENAFGSTGI